MNPVEHVASVAALHALDPFVDGPPSEPVVWWCRPTDDALVLGSRQSDELVDRAACDRAGLAVARRRSGGGAVIVRRDAVHWFDVVAPLDGAGDDVRGSMLWVGEAWRDVLAPHLGDGLVVHRGDMIVTPWSDLVCFAGVGPGEVLRHGGKLVGLSQRRTRQGIRVQCLVYRRPVAHEYRALLVGDLPAGAPANEGSVGDLDPGPLAADLAARLSR